MGPQIGAFGPNSILPGVGVHLSSLHPKWGIGPRVEPSHSSQPMAQPFENQKHAWPLEPVRLRASSPTAFFEGIGHHGSKGSGVGTEEPHGGSSLSTTFRGWGMLSAEWATAVAAPAPSSSDESRGIHFVGSPAFDDRAGPPDFGLAWRLGRVARVSTVGLDRHPRPTTTHYGYTARAASARQHGFFPQSSSTFLEETNLYPYRRVSRALASE